MKDYKEGYLRKGNKEKKSLILAGKIKSKTNERNERIITCLNVFNSILLSQYSHIYSTLVFSYHCVFVLFLHNASGL